MTTTLYHHHHQSNQPCTSYIRQSQESPLYHPTLLQYIYVYIYIDTFRDILDGENVKSNGGKCHSLYIPPSPSTLMIKKKITIIIKLSYTHIYIYKYIAQHSLTIYYINMYDRSLVRRTFWVRLSDFTKSHSCEQHAFALLSLFVVYKSCGRRARIGLRSL